MDAEETLTEPDNVKDQDTATIGHSRETASQLGCFGSGGDCPLYPLNAYAPQAQAFYYRGFDNANGEWDEYPSFVNSEALEIRSPGVDNENQSLLFHSGYGFNPHMPYGPYSSVTSPLLSVGGDSQVYSSQQFPYTGPPYYHQLVPPSILIRFDNANGEWDEYPSFVNSEALEIRSPGVDNENQSLLFHSGYGFNPHMPYGPYSSVTSPLLSVGGDSQVYSSQQFPYTGPPYYHQLVPPSIPYLNSPTPVTQPELTNIGGVDQQVDSMLFGSRPGYPSVGSFGRGSFPGAPDSFHFHDSQQRFDGPGSGGIWSDCSKPSGRQRSSMPLSPAVSPQPIGSLGSFRQSVGMASHQQRLLYGFGSGSNSYGSGYLRNHGSSFEGIAVSSLGENDRSRLSLENSRRSDRGNASLCSCNVTLDTLSEQNRGPRALKLKNQISTENNSVDNSKHSTSTAKFQNESFNQPDFITDYKDAKFFVIKSYSEDNVHKSIKYGVWASTPNGNRKLDAAYCQAKEKEDACPMFLFFSVNASAQFCGVAEMVGPVDFDKSVDYWQQDKWSGQFPVKWHLIKDVPNGQFRHIILENNDNKPVTNSRDTQEVKLQQGIEMLTIFKNYKFDMSILDDFDFYEDRQKAMQERKARQQGSMMAVRIVGESEHGSSDNISGDFIKQMSKSFAQVVRLDESKNEVSVADRGNLACDKPVGIIVKSEDGISVTTS